MMDINNENNGDSFESAKVRMMEKSKMLFSRNADGASMIKGSGIGNIMSVGSHSPEYKDVSKYFSMGSGSDKVKSIMGGFGQKNLMDKKLNMFLGNGSTAFKNKTQMMLGNGSFNMGNKTQMMLGKMGVGNANAMKILSKYNLSGKRGVQSNILGFNAAGRVDKILGRTKTVRTPAGNNPTNKMKYLTGFKAYGDNGRMINPREIIGGAFGRAKMQRGMSLWGDKDGDGVRNILDCNPLDKMRQGAFDNIVDESEQDKKYIEQGFLGEALEEEDPNLEYYNEQIEGERKGDEEVKREEYIEEENRKREETIEKERETRGNEPSWIEKIYKGTIAAKEGAEDVTESIGTTLDEGIVGDIARSPKKAYDYVFKEPEAEVQIKYGTETLTEKKPSRFEKAKEYAAWALSGGKSKEERDALRAAEQEGRIAYAKEKPSKEAERKQELEKERIIAKREIEKAKYRDTKSGSSKKKGKSQSEKLEEGRRQIAAGVGGSLMRGTPLALGSTDLITGVGTTGFGGVQKASYIASGGAQRQPWAYKVSETIGGMRSMSPEGQPRTFGMKVSEYVPRREEKPYSWKVSELLGTVRKELKEPDVEETVPEDMMMTTEGLQERYVRMTYPRYGQQVPVASQPYPQPGQAPRPPTQQEVAEGKTTWSEKSQRYVKYEREPYDKDKMMGYPQPYPGQYPQQMPQQIPVQQQMEYPEEYTQY